MLISMSPEISRFPEAEVGVPDGVGIPIRGEKDTASKQFAVFCPFNLSAVKIV